MTCSTVNLWHHIAISMLFIKYQYHLLCAVFKQEPSSEIRRVCESQGIWESRMRWKGLRYFSGNKHKNNEPTNRKPYTWRNCIWSMLVLVGSLAAAAKSLQSCPTLCDPIDGSPPGSPVPGILQARILEWVAISFSNAWMWKVKVKSLSGVRPLATPWTAAHQAPLSMGFSRQEVGSLIFP